jgi:hypothetical protein
MDQALSTLAVKGGLRSRDLQIRSLAQSQSLAQLPLQQQGALPTSLLPAVSAAAMAARDGGAQSRASRQDLRQGGGGAAQDLPRSWRWRYPPRTLVVVAQLVAWNGGGWRSWTHTCDQRCYFEQIRWSPYSMHAVF